METPKVQIDPETGEQYVEVSLARDPDCGRKFPCGFPVPLQDGTAAYFSDVKGGHPRWDAVAEKVDALVTTAQEIEDAGQAPLKRAVFDALVAAAREMLLINYKADTVDAMCADGLIGMYLIKPLLAVAAGEPPPVAVRVKNS